jgi:hypothetical protein
VKNLNLTKNFTSKTTQEVFMQKKIWSVLFFVVLAIITSAPSHASLVSSGSPAIIGSWTQPFNENGIYGGIDHDFNRLVITSSTDIFENPPLTIAGWTISPTNGYFAQANGPTTSDLNFNVNFWGTQSDVFSFTLSWYVDNTYIGGTVANWNGGWSFAETSTPPAVPIPAAAWLLGSGLVGLVALRRRQK